MGIIAEFTEFCLHTSLKGIPRILKSSSIGLRIMWFVAVVGFLMISGYEAYKLLSEYVHYPKMTTVTEKIINLTAEDDLVKLPDILICNLNIMSSDRDEKVPSLKEFYERLIDITTCNQCTEDDQDRLLRLRTKLMTPIGYYQYIGKENIQKIGHTKESFIISCQVLVLDGLAYGRVPCQDMVNITMVVSENYYNCFNLHLQQQKLVLGISLIIYLDNFDLEVYDYFDIMTDLGQSLGAFFLLYEEGTIPMFMRGMSMAPGTHTDIKFEIERRDRLPYPYGICNDQQRYAESGSSPYVFKETYASCNSYCLQKKIKETCGCLDSMSLGLMHYHSSRALPFCTSIALSQDEILTKSKCVEAIRNPTLMECMNNCSLECSKVLYHTKVSQATWPHRPLQNTFYNHFIKGRPYEKRFAKVEWNVSNSPMSNEEMYQISNIQDNFLKLTIYLSDNKYINLKDSPKMNRSNLISQLGGALNIWSGLTMMVFIELIELFIRIVAPGAVQPSRYQESQQSKNRSDSPVRDTGYGMDIVSNGIL